MYSNFREVIGCCGLRGPSRGLAHEVETAKLDLCSAPLSHCLRPAYLFPKNRGKCGIRIAFDPEYHRSVLNLLLVRNRLAAGPDQIASFPDWRPELFLLIMNYI